MRRFLKRVFLFVSVPVLLLAALYFLTDPYKTLKPFSLDYFDDTNRDYLSSELFLMNYPTYKYDSFIFGSSRGCGINTYHWAKYLPAGSKQFLFQGWDETITGIDQKVSYIDEKNHDLNNALVLLDIPGSFTKNQEPIEAMRIKDPHFSHQPRWLFQAILFYDFMQKPSQWLIALKESLSQTSPHIEFDVISNDWDAENKHRDLTVSPIKDSLRNMSTISRRAFLKSIGNVDTVTVSKPLINDFTIKRLNHIKRFFDRRHTSFKIIITPGFCYSYPKISPVDLDVLNSIFGPENVYDYSGENEWTLDFNNYTDPNHFGLYVGWQMIEGIYD